MAIGQSNAGDFELPGPALPYPPDGTTLSIEPPFRAEGCQESFFRTARLIFIQRSLGHIRN